MEKLLKRLQYSVNRAIETNEFNEDANWNYQQGILLDYKEAKLILDSFNQKSQQQKNK